MKFKPGELVKFSHGYPNALPPNNKGDIVLVLKVVDLHGDGLVFDVLHKGEVIRVSREILEKL